jgi:quercetin dioxygenase-like cupin family protein
MHPDRVFPLRQYLVPSDGEPLRSVVTQSAQAVVVAWHVQPGQAIAAHVHPHGQDTWTVVAGQGLYQVDAAGQCVTVAAGDVVVAPVGAVHGVRCTSAEPLVIVSVVCPAEAGYTRL